ncbi:MAG: DUF3298 and DUF4163 domain-containing protein [Clostridia bacterium]|nr:DUF3298 and DUF4163 domain-containing protein [Clostridia bacterium]
MQTITQHILTDQMDYQNSIVLNCQIRYPQFNNASCNQEALQTINQYYVTQAREKGRYCRSVLYPQAAEEANYNRVRSFPFFPYEFNVSYVVTYSQDCIFSLFSEQYTFTGGAHGSTLRTSETWDAKSGRQMTLNDFYPDNPSYIQDIQNWIQLEIAERLKANPGTYFDNYPQLLRNSFHPENFYMTPKGIVIYYQQYDIAPYSSGIPEFLLPFDANASDS